VHLFYVLSGFLITGILLDVREQPNRSAALGTFYLRRSLRIFPAFYLTLLLAWWADVPPLRETLPWHGAYLSNVQIVLAESWPGAISHFWSLAVEEQFYLLWPWLIVFVPRRWLMSAVVASVIAAPLFRWWMATLGYRENLLGVLTPGSMDSLGMGALLAVIMARRAPETISAAVARVWTRLTLISLLALIALLVAERSGPLPLPAMAVKQTLQGIVFAWLVFRAAEGFGGSIGRLLSAAPVVYVGRISYGAYLAHGFAGVMLALVGINSRALAEPWRLLALSGVTLAAAVLSWHLMEAPINSLKTRFPYARPPGAARDGLRRPSLADTAP
jgi:peptidoglycan/LPS O-acetylase OafA/YrhL